MFRKIGLVSAVCTCLTAPAVASYQLDHLQPLDSQELSNYRGGFLGDDFMINIGLDIATSINGQTLFNNRIANLFFQNGRLVATQPEVIPTTTVVQVGTGNTVVLPNIKPVALSKSSSISNPVVENNPQPSPPAVAPTSPPNPPQIDPSVVTSATQINISQSVVLPSVTQNTINRIIQNSLDGTVIDFQTVVNIDAQVDGVLRRMDRGNRIRQSLQLNFN